MANNDFFILIIDRKGFIINRPEIIDTYFGKYENIFDLDLIKSLESKIFDGLGSQKFLINILPDNYSFRVLENKFSGASIYQIYFEKFKISSSFFLNLNIKIKYKLKSIKFFNSQQQMVIFFLLAGYETDKEIFSIAKNYDSISERQIRRIIQKLFNLFEISSRKDLVKALKTHGLDSHVPRSIITSSIYDNLNFLGVCNR